MRDVEQTFTCIVQPTPAAPSCPGAGPGWASSVLGMGWAFATLLIVMLLLLFGPRGKLALLLDSMSSFISRMDGAKFGGVSLSAPAKHALAQGGGASIAGATPVVERMEAQAASADPPDADQLLIDKLLKKDFTSVSIGDYPYLMHEASRTPKARFKYASRVYLEFWTQNESRPQVNEVEKVYYRLDDTFPRPGWVTISDDAQNGFQVVLRLNGEFTIVAVVKFKNGDAVWLTRYLDLPGRPTE
jgi:hypothetical protein